MTQELEAMIDQINSNLLGAAANIMHCIELDKNTNALLDAATAELQKRGNSHVG